LSGAKADPAQVAVTVDGSALIVTERGTNSISSYALDGRGYAEGPNSIRSSGQTPYVLPSRPKERSLSLRRSAARLERRRPPHTPSVVRVT
jgi:6-phosphogluconolactonase (cycloisomerase 2 family)